MSIKSADEFRAFTQEIVANVADPDPAVAFDKIMGELSDEECRVALAVTLPGWLRSEVRVRDNAIRKSEPKVEKVGTSGTVRRIRDWAANARATRLNVGAEGYKFLQDCAAVNLRAAAQIRYDLAAANRHEGDRWAALADHMDAKGYATVADIPDRELRSFWAAQS